MSTDHIKNDVCPLCSGSGSITYGADYDRDCAALAATPSRAPASVQDEPWTKRDGETNAMYLERQARIAGESK